MPHRAHGKTISAESAREASESSFYNSLRELLSFYAFSFTSTLNAIGRESKEVFELVVLTSHFE